MQRKLRFAVLRRKAYRRQPYYFATSAVAEGEPAHRIRQDGFELRWRVENEDRARWLEGGEESAALARFLCRRRSRDALESAFSWQFYLESNPDVARWRYPAVLHYLIFGNWDLRDASCRFDTRFYLARYPDVARSGINALSHFAAFRKRDAGRSDHLRDSRQKPTAYRTANELWPETVPLVTVVIPSFN